MPVISSGSSMVWRRPDCLRRKLRFNSYDPERPIAVLAFRASRLHLTLPWRGRVGERSEPGWGEPQEKLTPPRRLRSLRSLDGDPPPPGEGDRVRGKG